MEGSQKNRELGLFKKRWVVARGGEERGGKSRSGPFGQGRLRQQRGTLGLLASYPRFKKKSDISLTISDR